MSKYFLTKKRRRCKYCQAWITWGESASGEWMPFNSSGTPHFLTCTRQKKSK